MSDSVGFVGLGVMGRAMAGNLLAGARPGHLLVDMSTVSPQLARRLAPLAEQAAGAMLDAPVSGGDVGAREGTLSIMVGGPQTAFSRARPLFEVLGRTIVHVGPAGNGQVVKACNQVVVSLPATALVDDMLQSLRQHGAGGLDHSALLTHIEQLSAHTIGPAA